MISVNSGLPSGNQSIATLGQGYIGMETGVSTSANQQNMRAVLESSAFVAVRKQVTQAISDYEMIRPDENVMVAVSGGKDSSLLMVILSELRRLAPFDFNITPVILDQHQPGFSVERYRRWMKEVLNFDLVIISEDTYSIVKSKTLPGKTYCGLCSRLRRGILYNYAHENGFTRIALGHHRDDLNETLLLNLIYNGKIASMPPRLRSDDGRNVVIRPLCYVAEKDISELSSCMEIPVIPCRLCGSQDGAQRGRVKQLIGDLEVHAPGIRSSLFAAQQNLRPSQLADKDLWDFEEKNPDHLMPH